MQEGSGSPPPRPICCSSWAPLISWKKGLSGATWLAFTAVHTTHLQFRACTVWLDFCLKGLIILINNLGLAACALTVLKGLIWEAPQLPFKFTRDKANLLEWIKLGHYLPCARQRTPAGQHELPNGPSQGRAGRGISHSGCHVKKVVANDWEQTER